MIHSDQLHIAKLSAIRLQEQSQGIEVKGFHVNRFRAEISPFIRPDYATTLLDTLSFTGELASLGMGWFRVANPVFISDIQLSVGCLNSPTDRVFKNAYIDKTSYEECSLIEWLGMPFLEGNELSKLRFDLEGQRIIPEGLPDVFWADLVDEWPQENWVSIGKKPMPEDGLLRYERSFYKEFYQKAGDEYLRLDPSDAYELASLKELALGRRLQMVVEDLEPNRFLVKQVKYLPKSIKLLGYLLSDELESIRRSTKFVMSSDAMEIFSRQTSRYIKLSKGRK